MMKLPLNTDLTDKVVVITGAGGVLCGMFAKALAQAGAKVAIAANGANLRNGGTATLNASASNTITATVTQGNAVRVYTVTVTGAA